MHPIERLRMVAGSFDSNPGAAAEEAAGALAALASDPRALVTACRRLVDRRPASGPLWWLSARLLASPDPEGEAGRAAHALAADPTARHLAFELPSGPVTVVGRPPQAGDALFRRGDVPVLVVEAGGVGGGLVRRLVRGGVEAALVPDPGLAAAVAASALVVLEASALGPGGGVATSGSRAAAAVARTAGIPVWMVAGVGRVLPGPLWEALAGRLVERGAPWEEGDELVPLDLVDLVAGPDAVEPVGEALARADCQPVPELLGRWGARG